MKQFGLIGVSGYIAPRHLQAIRDTSNNLMVSNDISDSVGVIDSFFPQSEFFTNLEDFKSFIKSSKVKLDYLTVCSPNFLHKDHILLGLENNIEVICEKPLVTSLKDFYSLEKFSERYSQKINTILQLRIHPSIISLKNEISNRDNNKIIDVDLTYITSRGKWYNNSWKGDFDKSGGIALNIGIHFFDMLIFIFGDVKKSVTNYRSLSKAGGVLEFENARVRWFLSIDEKDLNLNCRQAGKKTFRSILIDGKEFEFSDGFTDLHTQSYSEIIKGKGFSLKESKSSIELALKIMSDDCLGIKGDFHPYLKKINY